MNVALKPSLELVKKNIILLVLIFSRIAQFVEFHCIKLRRQF